ncbi:MAG: hypothetical protein HPZ91_10750 [Lentisphaeria bacterium]|nr:hypothetical protein [Lentisphaeria bacterium]
MGIFSYDPQKVTIFAHGARFFALQKLRVTFRGPRSPVFRAASGRTHTFEKGIVNVSISKKSPSSPTGLDFLLCKNCG